MTPDELYARYLHCMAEMLKRPLGVITDRDYTAEYFQLKAALA